MPADVLNFSYSLAGKLEEEEEEDGEGKIRKTKTREST